MRRSAGILGAASAALAVAAVVFALAAPAAQGAFGVAKWEAGTCKFDLPECTYASPGAQFFTEAAGHPAVGLTDFLFNNNGVLPEGNVKNVRVDLPEGLNVDPQAVPQCPKATFEADPTQCELMGSKVGVSEVSAVKLLGLIPIKVTPAVYNLVPDNGTPALFGFNVNIPALLDADVFLVADVAWNTDYHEGFTISNVPNTVPLTENRLVFNGTAGQGTFLTMGSQCNGPSTTTLKVESYEGQTQTLATKPPANIDQCQTVPFKPGIVASAGGAATDSPAPVAVSLTVPQRLQPQNSSTVKTANVALPRGLGLNPAAADGLGFCTDAQFGKGTKNPVACPANSQIGTASIQTPVLPANSLPGKVFLGQQLSRVPTSGDEYRIFVDAESPRYGLSVRLLGNVSADPATGQLTATIANAPQVAFSSFDLQFNGGDKAPLTSPPICGPNTTTTSILPWSGTPAATPTGAMTLTKAPGGGPCAKTMAERPFAPGFDAAPNSLDALAYTPFTAHLTRPQGQQELKGVDIHLPPGATAKLAGVPYCPPGDIADAAGRSGAAEKKKSSCPDDSRVGGATIQAGTGSKPLQIGGDVFLAGPYKGAPVSLAVITPALAGPFDLGTVVVRVPLKVDPETAQINPDTEIPDVFGGAKLDIRSIFVNVNRKEFTLNGTNCAPHAVAGNLLGGGADPTNPAAFAAAKVSAPVQLNGCKKLKFRPKLKLRLFGATHRNQHPRLRAALKARPGDANIARASVGLPHAIFLDQASLGTVCTRPQFAANACPKKSIYGKARAFTPLLGKPLEGPVVLRSNPSHTLPDMVAHLEGQVDIDLVGVIDSFKGGIRTTFNTVPDVPVSKFVLTLPGGKHGLLVASTNLCKNPPRAIVKFKGQNGKKVNRKQKLRTPCGKKSKKRSGKKHQRT
jgi:hypothetical protein